MLYRIFTMLRSWHRRVLAYSITPGAVAGMGWVLLVGHVAAIAVAWAVCRALPISVAQVEEAVRLGIHSQTIRIGYPKSHELTVYLTAEVIVIVVTIVFWWGWSAWRARGVLSLQDFPTPVQIGPEIPQSATRESRLRRKWVIDWVLIPVLIAYIAFDINNFSNSWFDSWTFLSEEGMILAGADRLLRGGVLYRDEFALYGPLMFYPVAWLLRVVDLALTLRVYNFFLDWLGLVLIYQSSRVFLRRRGWAIIGLGFYIVKSVMGDGRFPDGGINGSILRLSIGLAWLFFLFRDPEGPKRHDLILTGVALGVAFTFSQEIGVASCVSYVILVLTGPLWRPQGWKQIGSQLSLSGLGLGCVVLPWVAYFAIHGALRDAAWNLFVYPRYLGLGYGTLRFPSPEDLWHTLAFLNQSPTIDRTTILEAYWIPWIVALGAIVLGIRFLLGKLDRDDRIIWGLVLLSGILFRIALGRSDLGHLQPALVPALLLGLLLARRLTLAVSRRQIPLRSPTFGCAVIAVALSLVAIWPPWGVVRAFASSNLHPFVHKFRKNEGTWVALSDIPRARGVFLPRKEADEFGDVVLYITGHTRPDDPILVFPNEAAYYYYADRPNATRFSLAYLAVTHDDRLSMIKDLEKKRPPYIIYSMGTWRVDGIDEREQVPELVEYIVKFYVLEKKIGETLILRRREAAVSIR